ncbi:hypothetical protein MPTA5024_02385 [Microbispora sp. ATCC PTA-5024]|nr:hypothetical protein MPTA5024_02385 [Microbispora sp. ATCC PTA-5024]
MLKRGIDTSTPIRATQFQMVGAFDEVLRELIVEG